MATADLITQLKQDFDDVYAAGKAAGGGSGEDYLQYAKAVQFNSLNDFGKAEVELNLNKCTTLLNLCAITSAENRNNTVEHLTINCDNPTLMNSMLNCGYAVRDLMLKRLTLNINTSNVTNFSNAFNCLFALDEIDGTPFDLSSATNITNMFNYNNALKEVRFVEKTIPISINFAYAPSISAETIQSIIDGLADLTSRYYEAESTGIGPDNYKKGALIENIISVTEYGKDDNGETLYNVEYGTAPPNIYNTIAYKEGGGTAHTLTLHATVGSKLTDEQKATITAKNWELVY